MRSSLEQGGVGAPFVIYICVFYTLFTASIILHFISSRVGRTNSQDRTPKAEKRETKERDAMGFLVY